MGMTIIEKIFARKAGLDSVSPPHGRPVHRL
jgi:hypothetical protein